MAFGDDYKREVFEYNDGQQPVSADPLRIKALLHLEAIATGKSIDDYLDAIEAGDKDNPDKEADTLAKAAKWEATLALHPICCKVFNLPENTQIDYALGVLNFFYGYLQKKNPRLVWRPMSVPPTDSALPLPSVSSTPATMDSSSV